MIANRLPGRSLSFQFLSSKRTIAFLSRNVVSHYPSILHRLTPISDFSSARDKYAASPSTRARLSKMEMVVIGTSHSW